MRFLSSMSDFGSCHTPGRSLEREHLMVPLPAFPGVLRSSDRGPQGTRLDDGENGLLHRSVRGETPNETQETVP